MSRVPAGRLHRAVGIETEYGVTSARLGPGGEGAPLSVDEAVREVFRDVASPRSGTHRFTTSGARLYVDVGQHPEYAGPECVWVSDVVAQDLAGDAVLASMARAANARLEPRGARIHLLKSNTDAWGATFGCHENYQVGRGAPLALGGLVGLLAARQVLAGAGALPADAGGVDRPEAGGTSGSGGLGRPLGPMRYSARADHIHGAASADPTRERAFVNTRDEPHADASRWRRLHVVAADSAVSPWTTALKVVLMDAALTLVERGEWSLAECELAAPARAARVWNREPNTPCERADGRSAVTCPELLELVLERLAALPADETDELTARVLDLAGRGARALRSGQSEPVATELDWAIKHRVLARVAERPRRLAGCAGAARRAGLPRPVGGRRPARGADLRRAHDAPRGAAGGDRGPCPTAPWDPGRAARARGRGLRAHREGRLHRLGARASGRPAPPPDRSAGPAAHRERGRGDAPGRDRRPGTRVSEEAEEGDDAEGSPLPQGEAIGAAGAISAINDINAVGTIDAVSAADAAGAVDVVVLAGGTGRRLGGASKPDVVARGARLLDHVLTGLAAGAGLTVLSQYTSQAGTSQAAGVGLSLARLATTVLVTLTSVAALALLLTGLRAVRAPLTGRHQVLAAAGWSRVARVRVEAVSWGRRYVPVVLLLACLTPVVSLWVPQVPAAATVLALAVCALALVLTAAVHLLPAVRASRPQRAPDSGW